jgi:hypothetical protein
MFGTNALLDCTGVLLDCTGVLPVCSTVFFFVTFLVDDLTGNSLFDFGDITYYNSSIQDLILNFSFR